ncbi:RNA polymerase factor sigma-54 [Salipiger thiooxidans]|uniref:RNA polymerase factor sigma-54 n=1 Tax=Salipiger thiooxidans TaxID=282683 RepID=UPI001CD7B762|nr:RNA polymerase factor sigma-54 [Salipiger thiooxidans]MCA0850457.1 RNA polymerase factor sigma-54 [Salipiger thiooxidans]
MELVQTISQSQTMQMGGQLLQSLAILGMASNDLSEHIQERAEANPYVSYRPPAAFVARGGEDSDAVAAVAADRPSLMAHVVEQIERAFAAPSDHLIALHFAEALEPTGWLSQPVETIALVAGCPLRKAEQVLEVLQGFEPAGLFARSLSDCLLIQAREADLLTWEVETLIRNLDMLDGRRARLAELCDCEVSDIPDILGQIRGLNPKPGLAYDHVAVPVFPPDLIATRGEDGWTVELNRATTPTITVREDHASDNRADREARKLRRKALAEARALALALERRGDTLLRTGAVLVARQARFLERGTAYLVPLTLDDVAAELGVHASTISRAVSGRMIQTPTRALPLRAFFSRPVSTMPGSVAVSRDSMMDFVQRAVEDEDPRDPLSDDAIVMLAQRSGLQIARRTVAKYRSTLGLGSSYERRRRAIGA